MASMSFNETLRESLAYRSRIARKLAAAQKMQSLCLSAID